MKKHSTEPYKHRVTRLGISFLAAVQAADYTRLIFDSSFNLPNNALVGIEATAFVGTLILFERLLHGVYVQAQSLRNN